MASKEKSQKLVGQASLPAKNRLPEEQPAPRQALPDLSKKVIGMSEDELIKDSLNADHLSSEKPNKPVAQASLPAYSKENLQIYRRKLPHWRLTGAVYFVTWRLHTSQPELTPDERTFLVSAIEYFQKQRYEVYAYVVMNDHTHVLLKPINGYSLQSILHSWKSFAANQLQKNFGRTGTVWQDEYFDRIMRDEDEFLEKAQYILNNPRKRWPDLEEYPWVGFSIETD